MSGCKCSCEMCVCNNDVNITEDSTESIGGNQSCMVCGNTECCYLSDLVDLTQGETQEIYIGNKDEIGTTQTKVHNEDVTIKSKNTDITGANIDISTLSIGCAAEVVDTVAINQSFTGIGISIAGLEEEVTAVETQCSAENMQVTASQIAALANSVRAVANAVDTASVAIACVADNLDLSLLDTHLGEVSTELRALKTII